jgi:2-keto-4-pentenoate hydratase/2-oxohepta-3-ene-1,7-dioic acid hydratase in catechol pathway
MGKDAFSYFKKAERPEDIVKDGGDLVLRRHPKTQAEVNHWYEPELAMLLGDRHEIAAYCLANDLTASGIEFERSGKGYDPTYFGKCWQGSCSLGPRFFSPAETGEVENLDIGLAIVRVGRRIYERSYSTSARKREFRDLPDMILSYRRTFRDDLPASKHIRVADDGFLPAGTVILSGTGIIVPERYYAKEGDVVTVFSRRLGNLRNGVRLAIDSATS